MSRHHANLRFDAIDRFVNVAFVFATASLIPTIYIAALQQFGSGAIVA